MGGGSVDGPYLFESTKLTKVTVTDSFCHGDEFSVFDNGVLIVQKGKIVAVGDASTVRLAAEVERIDK